MSRTEILRLAELALAMQHDFEAMGVRSSCDLAEAKDLATKAKNDYRDAFPITNVSRLDLPSHIDRDNVTDEQMTEIAEKMADAYMNVFHIDLESITEDMELPFVTEEEVQA